jgi:hypothetical protein
MADATISRVRLRDLARLGRSHPRSGAAFGARPVTAASRRQSGTDAASIAAGLPPRPRAASSRPGTGELMASTIYGAIVTWAVWGALVTTPSLTVKVKLSAPVAPVFGT